MVLHAAVSAAEWEAGLLEPAKLAALARQFTADGYAVIGNAIPASALDALRERMDYDAALTRR